SILNSVELHGSHNRTAVIIFPSGEISARRGTVEFDACYSNATILSRRNSSSEIVTFPSWTLASTRTGFSGSSDGATDTVTCGCCAITGFSPPGRWRTNTNEKVRKIPDPMHVYTSFAFRVIGCFAGVPTCDGETPGSLAGSNFSP